MMTELDGKELGLDDNIIIIISHLVLPFGWISSPSYFQLFGAAIQALRESYGLDDVGWSGSGHFSSFIYVGDAIWVGNAFGNRLPSSVSAWEWACKRILNECAVDDIKSDLEGKWATKALILGFTIDTETNTISVPDPKIVAAQNLILSDEFTHGNKQLRLRTLRKLRGSCQHWSSASSFWKATLQSIDGLLGYADERGIIIRCGNQEVRRGFFSMVNLLRDLARHDDTFTKLPG